MKTLESHRLRFLLSLKLKKSLLSLMYLMTRINVMRMASLRTLIKGQTHLQITKVIESLVGLSPIAVNVTMTLKLEAQRAEMKVAMKNPHMSQRSKFLLHP